MQLSISEYKLMLLDLMLPGMNGEEIIKKTTEEKENPILVNLDKGAINRVFNNLIQNAIKYANSSFRISVDSEDDKVIIEFINDVKDINEDDLSLLFNRFYMRDKSRSSDSSGLGLTITKLLVESMNGEIDVNTTKEGIVFRLKFLKDINLSLL